MRTLLLSALLLQGACLSAHQADSVFKEIKELMDGFEKRFKAVEDYMNSFPEYGFVGEEVKDEKKAPKKKIVEISSDDNFILIKMNLDDLDYKKVDIEVDGDSLTGSVPIKDGKANFYVQNGRIFGISFKREIKKEVEDKKDAKENNKDKKELKTVEISESTKVESLPVHVCDLEKMEANYKDNVLELKLPKVPQKKGKKIDVAAGA